MKTLITEAHSALVETIKRKLKAQVLLAINAEIDSAVEEAVHSLEIALNMYEDPYYSKQVIEVILKGE